MVWIIKDKCDLVSIEIARTKKYPDGKIVYYFDECRPLTVFSIDGRVESEGTHMVRSSINAKHTYKTHDEAKKALLSILEAERNIILLSLNTLQTKIDNLTTSKKKHDF